MHRFSSGIGPTADKESHCLECAVFRDSNGVIESSKWAVPLPLLRARNDRQCGDYLLKEYCFDPPGMPILFCYWIGVRNFEYVVENREDKGKVEIKYIQMKNSKVWDEDMKTMRINNNKKMVSVGTRRTRDKERSFSQFYVLALNFQIWNHECISKFMRCTRLYAFSGFIGESANQSKLWANKMFVVSENFRTI